MAVERGVVQRAQREAVQHDRRAARVTMVFQYAEGGEPGFRRRAPSTSPGCGLLAVSLAVLEIGTCGFLLDHAQDRGRVQSSAEQDDA